MQCLCDFTEASSSAYKAAQHVDKGVLESGNVVEWCLNGGQSAEKIDGETQILTPQAERTAL